MVARSTARGQAKTENRQVLSWSFPPHVKKTASLVESARRACVDVLTWPYVTSFFKLILFHEFGIVACVGGVESGLYLCDLLFCATFGLLL